MEIFTAIINTFYAITIAPLFIMAAVVFAVIAVIAVITIVVLLILRKKNEADRSDS